MKITHKIALALLAVLIAMLAGAAITLDRSVRPGFERLEQDVHARNQARAAANLSALENDLRARVVDYANWDDTYAFVQGQNAGYTADLTDDWFVSYGLDLIVFADGQDDTLWNRFSGAEGAVIEDQAAARTLVAQATRANATNLPMSGVVWLPDLGFVVVAMAKATLSDGSGAPLGWVIMGRRLSAETLSEQAQMTIDLINPATAKPALAARLEHLQTHDVWRTPQALYALTPLRDPNGAITGAMLTTQTRDAMALGQNSISLALALFAALLIVAMAALWFLLRGLVIRRIVRLEAHLRAQRRDPVEMPLGGGSDEITRLTEAYNALVVRVRESGARERAAVVQREAEASANRMKSDFLANISHELRRPLDAIIGYAELIGEELQGDRFKSAHGDLDRITGSARQLLNLICEIFDLSRIDAGRLELRPETFRVSEMMDSVETLATTAIAERNVRLSVVCPDLGGAYSDRRRLQQCVANMVSSACRVSAEGGGVILSASRDGENLRFEVRADSASLSQAQLSRSLDPFGDHAESGLRRANEAGLALAIARKLAMLMGGNLQVAALPSGAAVFVLTTPATLDEADHRLQLAA